jgi:hypothetical protein
VLNRWLRRTYGERWRRGNRRSFLHGTKEASSLAPPWKLAAAAEYANGAPSPPLELNGGGIPARARNTSCKVAIIDLLTSSSSLSICSKKIEVAPSVTEPRRHVFDI